MDSRTSWSGTIFYSLLYCNSRIGSYGQKYLYSVISVIEKRLPGNSKMWTIAPFVDGHSAISPFWVRMPLIVMLSNLFWDVLHTTYDPNEVATFTFQAWVAAFIANTDICASASWHQFECWLAFETTAIPRLRLGVDLNDNNSWWIEARVPWCECIASCLIIRQGWTQLTSVCDEVYMR